MRDVKARIEDTIIFQPSVDYCLMKFSLGFEGLQATAREKLIEATRPYLREIMKIKFPKMPGAPIWHMSFKWFGIQWWKGSSVWRIGRGDGTFLHFDLGPIEAWIG